MAEQKQLLEKSKTRSILLSARADSASLFVHLDATSFRSRLTDSLSKMSKVFDFDSAVFSTGVYHRVFRGSLKYRLRHQQQQQTFSLYLLRSIENKPQNELDGITETTSRETTSTISPQAPPHARLPTTWTSSHRESLSLVRACEMRMLEDCDTFSAHYVKRLAELDAEQVLTYFDDEAGQITRRISQSDVIWRDPVFQQLLIGGPSGSLDRGPSMSLSRL
jgi:hypothetical protein